ncbi:MAG: hypothetical protein PHG00_17375 [Methylococcales bacterium]|nr:hypothetical protein [Methylococcales bacterium]
MGNTKVTILINQRPYHIDKSNISADEIRGLVSAAPDYEVWKIIKSPDPEGQLPVDDQLVTGEIEVKNGDKFRAVPPGTFGDY